MGLKKKQKTVLKASRLTLFRFHSAVRFAESMNAKIKHTILNMLA